MEEEEEEEEETLGMNLPLYKVIVVGDMAVGKTSWISRYCQDRFTLNYKTTIGIDFERKHLRYANIQFWDVAGQERFGNLTPMYYRGAHGVVVMVDASRFEQTLKGAQVWITDIHRTLGKDIPLLVLVNKSDLLPPPPTSGGGWGKEKAHLESLGLQYDFCSAKDNDNCGLAFERVLMPEIRVKFPRQVVKRTDRGIIITMMERERDGDEKQDGTEYKKSCAC